MKIKIKIITIILLIIILLTLASCNKSNDNETIQLWWYDSQNSGLYTAGVSNVINKLQLYCESNNIKLDVVKYDKETLLYDDYALKRNAAMAKGNMITIDDVKRLNDIAEHHADYSRAENYNNLMDIYKDRCCIPLGIAYIVYGFSNDILNHYGINTDRSLIFVEDYLDMKQEMKEKGAIFSPNVTEYNEIIEYYVNKNGLRYLDRNSEILADKAKLKEAMKKTAIDIYEDIKLYGKDIESFNFVNQEKAFVQESIFDEASGLGFGNHQFGYYMTDYEEFSLLNDEVLNSTFILGSSRSDTPCIYVYKKITNDKVYDVLNQLLDESYYKALLTYRDHMYTPALNTDGIRELLDLDENWEYNGILLMGAKNGIAKNIGLVNYYNEIFETIMKNKEKSNLLGNIFYSDPAYYSYINTVVSGVVQTLISEDLDYKDEEVEDLINKSIDEFITNLNVHYN